jgi:hypothetical protein
LAAQPPPRRHHQPPGPQTADHPAGGGGGQDTNRRPEENGSASTYDDNMGATKRQCIPSEPADAERGPENYNDCVFSTGVTVKTEFEQNSWKSNAIRKETNYSFKRIQCL